MRTCLFRSPGVFDSSRCGRRPADNQIWARKTSTSLRVEIDAFFSSPPLAGDSKNYCAPVYDVLQDLHDDDIALIIVPLLRRYENPRFHYLVQHHPRVSAMRIEWNT